MESREERRTPPRQRAQQLRHLAADRRPLVEDATTGLVVHLLGFGHDPTAETSPGVELCVRGGRVWVVHWLAGPPVWVVQMNGTA